MTKSEKRSVCLILSVLMFMSVLCSCGLNENSASKASENQGDILEETKKEAAAIIGGERADSIMSLQKISNFEEYNIYTIDISYDYNLDNLTPVNDGTVDTQTLMNLILAESIPGIDASYHAPDYGCSAFTLAGDGIDSLMGRNYDFKFDTSAILVKCNPKNGYKSVAFAALNNLYADSPESDKTQMLSCLASPFVCLDGMNEKGVSICVLTLPTEPAIQSPQKPVLATTILIRLVLDRAASTQEAIDLISEYDIYSLSGRDYHFYITDASGDGRVVEFDPDTETREMVVTPMRSITNFYAMYPDRTQPYVKNEYGVGKERWEKIEFVLNLHNGTGDEAVAWEALRMASQIPKEEEITSNTQWSVVYNNSDLTFEFVFKRRWEEIYRFEM